MSLAEEKLGKSNILVHKLDFLLNLWEEIQPHTYIEIGVFNCETFFKVVDTMNSVEDKFFGFDYFIDLPELLKAYEIAPRDERYITYEDACEIAKEKNKQITLVEGDTNETLYQTLDGQVLPSPIVVFVDGGHSYDTCYSDMKSCWSILKDLKGVHLFIDDLQFPSIKKACNDFIMYLRDSNFFAELVTYSNGVLVIRW